MILKTKKPKERERWGERFKPGGETVDGF